MSIEQRQNHPCLAIQRDEHGILVSTPLLLGYKRYCKPSYGVCLLLREKHHAGIIHGQASAAVVGGINVMLWHDLSSGICQLQVGKSPLDPDSLPNAPFSWWKRL